MRSLDYPNLEQLFSCYFHQDWTEEFNNSDDAINTYLASSNEETKLDAIDELRRLMDACGDNKSLQQALDLLGCYYDSLADNMQPNEWLKLVLGKLEAP